MHAHITGFVPGAILMAGLACVSCSDSTPADATAPTSVGTITFSVQPRESLPEFLSANDGCSGARAFRTRFVVVAGGMQGFVVQELRASFSDPFGLVTVPLLIPPTGPIRFDDGVLAAPPAAVVDAGSHPVGQGEQRPDRHGGQLTGVPVALEFGCHVRPRGTIVVVVGTRDNRGRSTTHRLTVDVGE